MLPYRLAVLNTDRTFKYCEVSLSTLTVFYLPIGSNYQNLDDKKIFTVN